MSSDGEIDATKRIPTSFGMPLYVYTQWEAKVPKGGRSAILTAYAKKHLGMQLSEEEKRIIRL